MFKLLSEKVSKLVLLKDEDHAFVESLFKYSAVKRGTILINYGEVSDRAFFVNSGYLRYFKNLGNGSEVTIHLFSPGEFATSFNSFARNVKAEETLHAVTDVELLSISKADLEMLYATDLKWQVFGRKLMEYFLLEKEKRIIDQLALTAQERYLKLFETNPDLIKNVPIQYLASFIGIKPESLSRIRKQIYQ